MKLYIPTKLHSLTHASLFSIGIFLSASAGHGALVTTIQDAFTDPNWSLLWNSDGPLGNPSNYSPQISTSNPIPGQSGQPFYAAIESDKFFLFSIYGVDAGYEGVMGGHPGPGFSSIFKFTFQTAGSYEVQNSLFSSIYASNDGMGVSIYLNNNSTPLATSSLAAGVAGATTSLNVSLGDLAAGDAVYFVVSPGGNNFADQFAVQLEIASVPEPASVALLIGAGIAFVLVRARKSARA